MNGTSERKEINDTLDDFFAACVTWFGSLTDEIEVDTSLTFRQIYLGDFKIVQLRCANEGNRGAMSGEIYRVFDRAGKPVDKVKLSYGEQHMWFKRLVVEECLPAHTVMHLLDDQSREFFWRERME